MRSNCWRSAGFAGIVSLATFELHSGGKTTRLFDFRSASLANNRTKRVGDKQKDSDETPSVQWAVCATPQMRIIQPRVRAQSTGWIRGPETEGDWLGCVVSPRRSKFVV